MVFSLVPKSQTKKLITVTQSNQFTKQTPMSRHQRACLLLTVCFTSQENHTLRWGFSPIWKWITSFKIRCWTSVTKNNKKSWHRFYNLLNIKPELEIWNTALGHSNRIYIKTVALISAAGCTKTTRWPRVDIVRDLIWPTQFGKRIPEIGWGIWNVHGSPSAQPSWYYRQYLWADPRTT